MLLLLSSHTTALPWVCGVHSTIPVVLRDAEFNIWQKEVVEISLFGFYQRFLSLFSAERRIALILFFSFVMDKACCHHWPPPMQRMFHGAHFDAWKKKQRRNKSF